MEIHNPLNIAEILSPNVQYKQHSKIAYFMNGSWYFNKTKAFASFEEESIGSIQYGSYSALYSKCDQVSDLWQQLELVFEFESDL